MSALVLATWSLRWVIAFCAVCVWVYARLCRRAAELDRAAAMAKHPAGSEEPYGDDLTRMCEVVGVLRRGHYTLAELDLVRDVDPGDWQAVIDAHRRMEHVATPADLGMQA